MPFPIDDKFFEELQEIAKKHPENPLPNGKPNKDIAEELIKLLKTMGDVK